MFQHRELGLVQAFQVCAAIVITLVFWGCYIGLRMGTSVILPGMMPHYLSLYIFLILTLILSFLRSKQYDILSVSSGIMESHRFVWPHLLFSGALSLVFLALLWDTRVSRFFLVLYFPAVYLALVLFSRFLALDILRFFLGRNAQKMLLVGNPAELAYVSPLLEKSRLFGFEAVGIATDATPDQLPRGLPCLGAPDNLSEILHQHPEIGNLFFIGSPRDRRRLGDWLRMAEAHGCRVSLVNDLDIFLQRRLSYFQCDNIDLIELRQEPLQNVINRAIKRTLDIVVSLPVVCFVLPLLMVVVWFFQRLQAPGPLFFRQTRSGLDNRRFVILKFRTMYVGNSDSARQASAGDTRVYPAGRFFRRFSLDEFPQFLNVLSGHMSVVGPRPHMIEHDTLFSERMSNYPIRGFVKPGITGLAQIHGFRGETATPEAIVRRVEYDIDYIEKWEPVLDLRILWRTAVHIIRPPKTAY